MEGTVECKRDTNAVAHTAGAFARVPLAAPHLWQVGLAHVWEAGDVRVAQWRIAHLPAAVRPVGEWERVGERGRMRTRRLERAREERSYPGQQIAFALIVVRRIG